MDTVTFNHSQPSSRFNSNPSISNTGLRYESYLSSAVPIKRPRADDDDDDYEIYKFPERI